MNPLKPQYNLPKYNIVIAGVPGGLTYTAKISADTSEPFATRAEAEQWLGRKILAFLDTAWLLRKEQS